MRSGRRNKRGSPTQKKRRPLKQEKNHSARGEERFSGLALRKKTNKALLQKKRRMFNARGGGLLYGLYYRTKIMRRQELNNRKRSEEVWPETSTGAT